MKVMVNKRVGFRKGKDIGYKSGREPMSLRTSSSMSSRVIMHLSHVIINKTIEKRVYVIIKII